MKWLLVLIAMNQYADGSAEHYILTNPNFNSLEQCQQEAVINQDRVNQLAFEHFGGPARVYCFREDNLKEYLEKNQVGKTEKKKAI